jgi:hypothetical protein
MISAATQVTIIRFCADAKSPRCREINGNLSYLPRYIAASKTMRPGASKEHGDTKIFIRFQFYRASLRYLGAKKGISQ